VLGGGGELVVRWILGHFGLMALCAFLQINLRRMKLVCF